MRVIKPGRSQTGWSKEHICTGLGYGMGGCGAVLFIEATDLYKAGPLHRPTFTCCECGRQTSLLWEDVSEDVAKNLLSRQEWEALHG